MSCLSACLDAEPCTIPCSRHYFHFHLYSLQDLKYILTGILCLEVLINLFLIYMLFIFFIYYWQKKHQYENIKSGSIWFELSVCLLVKGSFQGPCIRECNDLCIFTSCIEIRTIYSPPKCFICHNLNII